MARPDKAQESTRLHVRNSQKETGRERLKSHHLRLGGSQPNHSPDREHFLAASKIFILSFLYPAQCCCVSHVPQVKEDMPPFRESPSA